MAGELVVPVSPSSDSITSQWKPCVKKNGDIPVEVVIRLLMAIWACGKRSAQSSYRYVVKDRK